MDMKNMFYNVAIKIAARKWTGHQREAIQILVNCNNDRQVGSNNALYEVEHSTSDSELGSLSRKCCHTA